VHNIVDIEARGVPGVFVATQEFVDGAQTQAHALGAEPAAVFVAHPIQDRSDDEMLQIADAAFEEVLSKLLDG